MILSYRSRQRLRRIGITLAVLSVTAVVVWLLFLIWVSRYIVYTQDGARLDFNLSPTFPSGQEATPPPAGDSVTIIFDDLPQEETTPLPQEPQPIQGYYISLSDLRSDPAGLKSRLEQLSPGTAVMLDLKDGKGQFYYSTALGEPAPDMDIAQLDELIGWLANSHLYVIGKIPAFRDWAYGLNHVDDGLPKVDAGGALWWDEEYYYWLNPTREGTLNHLTQIILELRLKGFDEVVLSEFCFPDTDQIVFEGDRQQALTDAAQSLAQLCSNDRFHLSFLSTDAGFPLPQGNCRLYLENIPASDVQDIAQQAQTDDPKLHLLFLTTTNDTRFNDYCVLRPLPAAL